MSMFKKTKLRPNDILIYLPGTGPHAKHSYLDPDSDFPNFVAEGHPLMKDVRFSDNYAWGKNMDMFIK
jgi:hypothetical protein